jgi:hypothetical protein
MHQGGDDAGGLSQLERAGQAGFGVGRNVSMTLIQLLV